MTRSVAWIAGIAAVFVWVVWPTAVIGTVVLAAHDDQASCASTAGPGGAAQHIDNRRFGAEEKAIAHTIVSVAMQRNLPRRAAVLAIATGIVESGLRNLDYGDRDSLGVYQQRPSQGWGTPEQVTDPVYATNQFFDRLLDVPNWARLPPGKAEQAVQRSAFPDRYGPQEPVAATLVEQLWRGPDNPIPSRSPAQATTPAHARPGCPDQGGADTRLTRSALRKLPPGFRLPTDADRNAAVGYAVNQLGKPYVWGAAGPDAFDCSGLMMAAWSRAGRGIPRTTTEQAHTGRPVASLRQAQPGDLLLIPGSLGSPSNPRHVGMYAGGGVVINAYDSSTGVVVQPLSDWADQIVTIRRVTEER